MKAFRVKGEFLMRDTMSPFNREIEAENKDDAHEKIVSLIGSEHRCKRNKIKIEDIVEVMIKARIMGC